MCCFVVCTSGHHECVWDSQRSADPGTEATAHCEPPPGYWESNPGPLEEYSVLLTAEQSPSSLSFLSSVYVGTDACALWYVCGGQRRAFPVGSPSAL